MNRVLLITSIFVLGLLVGLLVLAYFAYVIETGPPESWTIDELGSDVTVSWSPFGIAAVEAEGTMDAMIGLGYAQASRRTWPLLLYRAAALGRLSEVAGLAGLDSDRAVVRLGIGEGAGEAFASLSDDHRAALAAYATGVNAALQDRRILRDPALILSGVEPRPWEPWHSIAIERLFAWLGTDAIVDTVAVRRRPTREALLLHDFDRSAVVTSSSKLEHGIYARFVFGSSALPVLFEARVSSVYGEDVQGATLLGTPFFLTGGTDERAWAIRPSGRYSAHPIGSAFNPSVSHRRIQLPDGSEQLVSILA
ncbi:MAG: penicillin acylase family protein, partial [Rhodothermia bacterium]|nr:penicillin acylase family protein [Rhodothermia bacterium]